MTEPMPEHAVRARRNVIVTSVGISLFYIGGGQIKNESGLGLLGITDLDPVAIKITVGLMFLWFLWRYAQCCLEKNCIFRNAVKDILFKRYNKVFTEAVFEKVTSKYPPSKGIEYFQELSMFNAYTFNWAASIKKEVRKKESNRQVNLSTSSDPITISIFNPIRLKATILTIRDDPSFTDWIAPWIIALLPIYLIVTGDDMQHVYAEACSWLDDCLKEKTQASSRAFLTEE